MKKQPLKILYMGTPDFAVPALQKLIDSEHEVVGVYTQPPRPKGRGHKVQKSPIHTLAETYGLPVYTPKSLKPKRNPEGVAEFQAHKADIAIVAAYGLILPQEVLDAPKYGCLNIHGSLLPRWRGAAPIQYSIWKGDAETGVTIMQMNAGLDTGDMISKDTCPITIHTTSQSLYDELSQMGARMLLPLLDQYAQGVRPHAEDQDDSLSNYASMLSKEDGKIDWSVSAKEISQQIRALNPWPGTYCEFGTGSRIGFLKIKEIKLTKTTSTESIGTVLDNAGHVVCGGGEVVCLVCIQPPNKQVMDFASAMNGGYISVGDVLQ